MTKDEFFELIKPESLRLFNESKELDEKEFVLQNSSRKDIPVRAIAEQIAAYKKAKSKLPSFAKLFLFEKKALEQATSEFIMRYKAELFSGLKAIDLTGGLGIDAIGLSKQFDKIYYCEMNEILVELFKYNISLLQIDNIKINNCDSIKYLEEFEDNYFDLLYVDPARRDETRRSVDLNFCEPDVIRHKELLMSKTKTICMKLSPAFDLKEAKKIFPEMSEFILISLDGELKECLVIISDIKKIKYKAVMLSSKSEPIILEGEFSDKKNVGELKSFIYIPDSAIEKCGLTHLLLNNNIFNINDTSTILTSDFDIIDFPGRKYRIIQKLPYKKKEIENYLKRNQIEKVNFIRTFFPENINLIKKKVKIKEGGEDYLFFYNKGNEYWCLHCKK